jgi:sugar O-acyltransferase (sialic acid O-acetyltransferase NeuD family)
VSQGHASKIGPESDRPIRLVVLGDGGLARRIAALVDVINEGNVSYRLLGLTRATPLDDNEASYPRSRYTILGTDDVLGVIDAAYVIGLGSPERKRQVAEQTDRYRRAAVSLVDPSVRIERPVALGPGSVIMAGVFLEVDACLGRHVLVNGNSVVGHDCIIGSYSTVGPNCVVGGASLIGEGVYIGAGSVVLPGIRVGARSVIGAGAVVNEVRPGSRVVGVPARPIREETRSAILGQ